MKCFKIYSMTTQENELPLEPEKRQDEEKKVMRNQHMQSQ